MTTIWPEFSAINLKLSTRVYYRSKDLIAISLMLKGLKVTDVYSHVKIIHIISLRTYRLTAWSHFHIVSVVEKEWHSYFGISEPLVLHINLLFRRCCTSMALLFSLHFQSPINSAKF